MTFTRVYVGAHDPLDVLAGLALGGTTAYLGARLLVPVFERHVLRPIAASPASIIVTAAGRTAAEASA